MGSGAPSRSGLLAVNVWAQTRYYQGYERRVWTDYLSSNDSASLITIVTGGTPFTRPNRQPRPRSRLDGHG